MVIEVDGKEIASESVALPHEWEEHKTFDASGEKHTLVAHSTLKKLFGILPIDNEYTVAIDGRDVLLKKTK